MKTLIKNLLFIFIVSTLVACNKQDFERNTSNSSKEDYYKNKEIEIIVPFEVGGGTDIFARFMSMFLSKNIEGAPTVRVVNIPGDNTIIGTNEFVYLSEENGYRLLASSASVHTPYLIGQKSVKYDLRTLEPIIGVPTGGVVYISSKIGISSPKEIVDLEETFEFSGISATGLDLVTLLSFEVLDLDVNVSWDNDGRRSASFAFEQGDSTIDFQTTSSYLRNIAPLVEKNEAIPLFSFGQIDEKGNLIRDPIFPELPTLQEVYTEMYGVEPSGHAWKAYKAFVNASYTVQKVIWTHSDAPSAAIEALHDGAERIINNSSLTIMGQDVFESYEPYVGKDLRNRIDNAFNTSPEILNWVRELLKEKYSINH